MKKKLLGFLLVLCVALLMLCTTAMADVCQCIDTNGDCVCDTCRQPYHSDANTDHTCDNCGETVGVCADNNFDGTCDYGCGKTFTYVTITSSYEVCPQLDYNLTWNFNKGSAEEAEVKYVKLGRSLRFHPWGTQQVTFTSSQINDVLAQESVLDVEFMIDFSVNAVKASRTETYRLIGKHHDDNADDLCDSCGKHLVDCTDSDGDFRCDGCGEHVHHDEDQDHNCDWCGAAVSKHEDKDYNHLCDLYGAACGRQSSIAPHADSDGDHLCDYCGEDCHTDANKDHTCETCGETVGVCADNNFDGTCDYGCGKTFTYVTITSSYEVCPDSAYQLTWTLVSGNITAVDYNLDGQSDWDGTAGQLSVSQKQVGRMYRLESNKWAIRFILNNDYQEEFELSWGHTDGNSDHKCDYGCGKSFGVCADPDLDHKCDYGCGKDFGVCADPDLDHKCDYGCGKSFGTCADPDLDHKCDYGCGKSFGVCADPDLDHKCDYGCGKTFGTCADPDLDHKCDYGCGKAFGTCADPDLDHKCDYGCGKTFGTCADPDLDHKCDYGCGKTFGTCADPDLDHKCDYGCGKDFGVCADPDLDHKCDYGCGKTFGTCADPDLDHKCDYGCGKTFGVCEDTDTDHKCDYGCGKAFGVCEDTDKDHLCDYGCGKVLSDHSYTAVVTKPTCTADGYTTYTCAICGDTYTADATRATGHWYGLWGADGQQAHTAYCKHDNCRHASETLCTRYEVTADASGSLLTVCPVCGEFGEVCFEELADAQITAIDRNALPRGAAIVRGLDKPFGNVLYAFTAVYEFAGEVQPFSSKVSVSLMLNVDLADFRLVRVDVTPATADSARTETWTELAFTFADGKLTFETEHEGLFLLLPMN